MMKILQKIMVTRFLKGDFISCFLVVLVFSTTIMSQPYAKLIIDSDVNCDVTTIKYNPFPSFQKLLKIGRNQFSASESIVIKGNNTSIVPCSTNYVIIKPDESYVSSITNPDDQNIGTNYGVRSSFVYVSPNPSYTVDKSKPVGMIPGSHSVAANGAALYSMPIDVPPGIKGVQPNLSIVYNSNGVDGLLGWGTELAGLSTNSRVGSNIYFDGKMSYDKIKLAMAWGRKNGVKQ